MRHAERRNPGLDGGGFPQRRLRVSWVDRPSSAAGRALEQGLAPSRSRRFCRFGLIRPVPDLMVGCHALWAFAV